MSEQDKEEDAASSDGSLCQAFLSSFPPRSNNRLSIKASQRRRGGSMFRYVPVIARPRARVEGRPGEQQHAVGRKTPEN